MNNDIHLMNTEGLKFFGKVNASISHELKNILAIISETAGFLNDLTELAKKGKELKLNLLENCSKSIAEEIQRGFSTIRQMNRFAHSVDHPVMDVDLMDSLDLMVGLSRFLSYAGRVQIEDKEAGLSSTVTTSPFLLQDLIYQVLCSAYESTGPEGEIRIRLSREDDSRLCLTFISSDQMPLKDFSGKTIGKIANMLDVVFKDNPSFYEINISIPYTSDKINLLAENPLSLDNE